MSASFLQSEEWECLQRALGRKTFRAAGALLVRHDFPLGFHYLYAPRAEGKGEFVNDAAAIAKREGSMFLKIDPLETPSIIHGSYRESHSIQPRQTSIVDLLKGEEELLRVMHPKTRYNIRVAERAGVSIEGADANVPGTRETFWRLLEATAVRDGFRTHPRHHYDTLTSIRTDDFSNEIFFARLGGEVYAAALVNFYVHSGTATYLHGASGRTRKEVMAPTLLHWRIMQEAIRRGLRVYDLGGIDDARRPGLTRFKRGFGGTDVAYPATIDYIYRPLLYRLYCIARRILLYND